MKLLDKVIVFFYTFIVLLFSLIFLLLPIKILSFGYRDAVMKFFSESLQSSAIALLMILFSLKILMMVFSKKKVLQNEFIEKSMDSGQMNISFETIKQLVQTATSNLLGIKITSTLVDAKNEGIVIHINASIQSDLSIPEVTKDVQSNVKEYVERMTGLTVHHVKVAVSSIDHTL